MTTLDTLDNDSLRVIFDLLGVPLALKLTCRSIRAAAPKQTESSIRDALVSVNMAQWARSCGMPWNERIYKLAAGGGHLEFLKWWVSHPSPHGTTFFWDVQQEAIKFGQIHVLEWTMPILPRYNDDHAFKMAAFCGRTDVMSWMLRHYSASCTDPSKMSSAARGGHLPAVKYLMKRKCDFTGTATTGAAREGHLHVLKWLWNKDLHREWNEELHNGSLIRGSAKWNPGIIVAAAQGGHMDIVQWAHAKGCRVNANTPGLCDGAATCGRLDILKWAYALGSKPSCQVPADAAQRGDLNILKWVHSLRPDLGSIPNSVFEMAAANDQIAVLEWGRSEHLITDPRRLLNATRNCEEYATGAWIRANYPGL